MKRGKTKRQTAKDGIRSNQGISRYICMYTYIHIYIYMYTLLSSLYHPPRFLLIYSVACNPIPSTPRFIRFLLAPRPRPSHTLCPSLSLCIRFSSLEHSSSGGSLRRITEVQAPWQRKNNNIAARKTEHVQVQNRRESSGRKVNRFLN